MKNKKILMVVMPLVIVLVLSFVYLGLIPSATLAQSTQYPVSNLTAANNSKILIQTQAIEFKDRKWTYHFTWKRTRDAAGMIKISPIVNESLVEAKLDPAPRESTSPFVARLDPATRYVLRYYAAPSVDCDQSNVASDPECLAIETVYFNTRNESGQIMATSEIPLSQGGTKIETGGTTAGSTGSETSLGGLQAQINQLLQLVQTLIAQLATRGVTLPNVTLPSATSTLPLGSIGNVQAPVGGAVLMRIGSNEMWHTGLRQAPEPIQVFVNPTADNLIHGNRGNKIENPDTVSGNTTTREIWVYATEGRNFSTWMSYVGKSCNDSEIQIQKNWGLPSGINYQYNCSKAINSTVVVDGSLTGAARSAGEYVSTITTTRKNSAGTTFTDVTKIRIFVLKANTNWPVTVQPIGTDGLPTSGNLPQGNRAKISWSQETQIVGAFGASSVDIWIAPASGNAGKHPDFITNEQLITTIDGMGGRLTECNNSTRGGGDPYQSGCGSFNWIIGKTLGPNMSPGDYIVYVTPHLPTTNSNGIIGSMYGQCGIIPDSTPLGYKAQTNCYGYSYGMTRITITAPTGTGLTSSPAGISLPSFSDIEGGLFYVRRDSTGREIRRGSVGIGTGSNSDQAGCGGNDSGGVDCGITINANAGDSIQIDWKSMFRGQPAGQSHDSNIWISGPYDTGNAAELAAIRDCTQNIAPGGFGPSPSQGFMNSAQGSKTFTINSCLSGKVIYLTYTVWMYGCGNLTGTENYVANQTNPDLVLSSGQTACRLAVKGQGTIIINVNYNNQLGDIVQGTCRLPVALTGGKCTLNAGGTSYSADWDDLEGSLPQRVLFYSAPGNSSLVTQNAFPLSDMWTFGKNYTQVNAPITVSGLTPNTTYWNKLVATCGLAGQEQKKELSWSCTTGPASGSGVSSISAGAVDSTVGALPAAPAVENTGCTTGNADDSSYIFGTKYTATWAYPQFTSGYQFNPLTDKLVFRVAKGSSYNYQNGNWVKANPAQDDTARQAVSIGCPSGTTCHIKDNDVLADPQNVNKQETYYVVAGTEPRTTYWNRVAFVKNFGLANQSIIAEKTWSCNTNVGNLPR